MKEILRNQLESRAGKCLPVPLVTIYKGQVL